MSSYESRMPLTVRSKFPFFFANYRNLSASCSSATRLFPRRRQIRDL